MARRRMLFDEKNAIISISPTSLSFGTGSQTPPQYIDVKRVGSKPLKVEFRRVGKSKDLNTLLTNGDLDNNRHPVDGGGGTYPPITTPIDPSKPGGDDITHIVGPAYTPKFKVEAVSLNRIKVSCDTNLGSKSPIDEIWAVSLDNNGDSGPNPYFEFHLHQDGSAPVNNYIEVRSMMGSLQKDINYTIGTFQIGTRLPTYDIAQRKLSIGVGYTYELNYTTNILVDESLNNEYLYFRKKSNYNAQSSDYLSKMDTTQSVVELWVDGAYSIKRSWNSVSDGGTIAINFGELPTVIYPDSTVTISVSAPPKYR